MYRDFSATSDADALHRALYAGAIARFRDLAPMPALVAFARGFLEERFAPFHPVETHRHHDEPTLATIYAAAQRAHIGVQNHTDLTRISLEARSLRIPDHLAGRGASNVDGRARWMTPGLFRRVSDGKPLTEVLGIPALQPLREPWLTRQS